VRDGETEKVSAGERIGRRRTRIFVERGGVLDALKRWRGIHGVAAWGARVAVELTVARPSIHGDE
jgi:hypothetical protein